MQTDQHAISVDDGSSKAEGGPVTGKPEVELRATTGAISLLLEDVAGLGSITSV